MIILFGTKTIYKDMGIVGNYECSRCHNVSEWKFMEYRNWFTLFFIPVFPISRKHEYLQCPICNQAYTVPDDVK
ncbi:zinc ribbon domain-containing protein [Leptotrichia sp. OH3620_COT-345]|uniref:zinc ribbon domain-containing protein n=1 Tax=Leptotrichia sp. OH3620_COT-345 TaxID=2491048 RepID=UPI000F64E1A6|nr:zinc ribbon domain-containing protein [Leptotrichia sp. OH3620_COT-345]RRD40337.1 zinc ribbon domain-containing protein [Leptotrichia sp. OH3620_COT-345]